MQLPNSESIQCFQKMNGANMLKRIDIHHIWKKVVNMKKAELKFDTDFI